MSKRRVDAYIIPHFLGAAARMVRSGCIDIEAIWLGGLSVHFR